MKNNFIISYLETGEFHGGEGNNGVTLLLLFLIPFELRFLYEK